MSLKRATVLEVVETRRERQTLQVRVKDQAESIKAYNYLGLGSSVVVGQSVLVNTTGIDLELGTGGVAFVVPSEPFVEDTRYGHIIKLRYSPLQRAVDAAEEQNAPSHELLQNAQSIQGMPAVCAELHSQMPLVAAAIKHQNPQISIAYLMNDAASLPMAVSDLVSQCTQAELINYTISCGQAFGGEYEAINLYSALLTARHVCEAQVAIVAPGPGVVGSDTVFGHSGIAQGEALNAVTVLEGKPIAPLRLSWNDLRKRHQGLSHHSATALGRVCLGKALIPLPGDLDKQQSDELMGQLEDSGILNKHTLETIQHDFSAISTRGIVVTTMGRGREEDPAFFSAAFAAGIQAARVVEP